MTLLEKVLRYIVLTGVFFLPLIVFYVATSMFFPYIVGKNMAFRLIVEIMTGAWLALALIYPKYRPRQSWILLAFATFALVMAIADAQGANPFKSFWSNFERMDGFVTLAHLALYTMVTAAILNSEKLWQRLMQWMVSVSVIVSLYGLLQIAGFLAIGQATGAGLSARIDATFGNPIYLAIYMLFHIFIAALLWARAWQERPSNERKIYTAIYGSAIFLNTLTLLFTGTRGTIIGLVGGATIAGILLVLLGRNSRYAWRAAAAIFGTIVIVGGGLWALRDNSFVRNVGFLDRLASISANDATIKSRFLNMSIAWRGVQERPLFGWGQENYAIVFDKYYDPRMYAQEPWFDRTHDIIFDWLVAGGFLGLLAYLSLFAASLWALWRPSAARGNTAHSSAQMRSYAFPASERSILTGLLAGYFFHNLFVFDNVTSYILFGTVLAYIAWKSSDHENAPYLLEKITLPTLALPVTAILAVGLVWGSVWYVNAAPLAANRQLIQALINGTANPSAALAAFTAAAESGTYGNQEAREQLAQAAANVAGNKNVPNDIKQQFYTTAVTEMQKQEQISPLDARFPLFLGIVFNSYGNYKDAAAALTQAHNLSPQKQNILFQRALNYETMGDTASALADYKQAFDLLPENSDARFFYASALIRSQNDPLADQVLAPVIASGDAIDSRVAQAYASRNRYDKIVTIWQAHVAAQPTDVKSYFTLAAALYANKQVPQSIAVLQDVATKFPSVANEANQYITQIKNGTIKTQ